MLLPGGVTRAGLNTSANKGLLSQVATCLAVKPWMKIPGCTAQLLEVGIPWTQDFLATLLQGSADPHAQFFQEIAAGPTAS